MVFDAPGTHVPRRAVRAIQGTRARRCRTTCARSCSRCSTASRQWACRMLRITGVEADDVIGTLAKQAAAQDIDVLISTGDKDIAQIVSDRITLVNTMIDSRLDREGVKNKFGVWPEQVMDYLALIGDNIDNIPGIDKVGPKTAAKWLNEYGTLDQLVANAAAITGKVGENLRAGLQTLELSRKLATIDSNLKLDCDLESLVRREPNKDRLRELYTRFEFRQLLRALDGGVAPGTGTSAAACGGIGSRRNSTADELRNDRHDGGSAALDREAASGRADRSAHRNGFARLHGGGHRRHRLLHRARQRRVRAAGARLCRRARAACLVGSPAGAATAARERAAGEDRTSHQVRRARAEAQRHRAARHALRFDAGIVRVEQHRDAPRCRRSGPTLPRLRSDPLRRPDRPRREADSLQPGRGRQRDQVRRGKRRHRPAAAWRAVDEHLRRAGAADRCTSRSSSRSCRFCSGWSRQAC